MGKLTRQYDWSKTVLGDPSQWPESLRTTVSLLLNSQFPMFVWWGSELITIYNDAYRIIAGAKHPALLGQSGREGWSEIWNDLQPLVTNVFNGHSTWAEDMLLMIERGNRPEETYFTFSYSPVLNEDGSVAGLFCAVIETTEKVMAKRRVEESESLFRNMVEQSTVPIGMTRGREMVFEAINGPMLQLIGRSRNIVNKPLFEVMPELKGQEIETILLKVWDTGQPYKGFEVPAQVEFDGVLQLRYYDISYTPIFREGDIHNIIHVAVDVTQQVDSKRIIRESQQRFYNLIKNSNVGIVLLLGEEMEVSIVNDAYGKLINRSADELLNQPLFDIIPDAAEPYRAMLDKVRTTGESVYLYDAPYKVIANGKTVEGFLNVIYQPYSEPDGTITGVMAMVHDVTEQVKARERIFEADERASLAIDAGDLGTVEVNLQNGEVIASEKMREIFELSSGDPWNSFISSIHPDDLDTRKKAHEEAYRSGILEYEARVLRKDGSIKWIHVKGRIFFGIDQKPLRLISVVQDVTKEKDFAEELKQQVNERTRELKRSNEELQQFAHVASHDLKEPVRKIRIFGNRLMSEFCQDLPEKAKFYLDRIESAGERIFKMIEGVLHYSSMDAVRQIKEDVSLNSVIKQIREDLEILIDQKQAVINAEDLPVIEGSNVLIYQMFYNLINNSLKFTKPGRTPVIDIRYETLKVNHADHIKIFVADNGIGFDQSNAEAIFGTFNRLNSKDQFEGTGLGLSLCKKIAERHGGSISAEGVEDEGALFIILLPVKQ